MCETKGFLQKNVLEELNNYLQNNKNDIFVNFWKYFQDKNIELNNYYNNKDNYNEYI